MAGQKFKVENGIHVIGDDESLFEQDVKVNGRVRINGDLLFVNGNLEVSGETRYTTEVTGTILPGANTGGGTDGDLDYDIGSDTKRWRTGYFGNVVVSSGLFAGSNNRQLGNTSMRFNAYFTNVYASGTTTLIGNVAINTDAFVVDTTNKRASVNATPLGNNALTIGGTTSLGGNVAVTGQVIATANVTGTNLILTNGGVFTNTATITSNIPTICDSFSRLTVGAVKYLCYIYSSAGGLVQTNELLIVQNGTSVFMTRYGETFNTKLGEFDADISGNTVLLTFQNSATPSPNASYTYTVKTLRQQLG